MAKLTTKGGIALFEYPQPQTTPDFNLEADGTLWVGGYQTSPFGPNDIPIRAMKRYPIALVGYKIIGRLEEAMPLLKEKLTDILSSANVDRNNCLVLTKEL